MEGEGSGVREDVVREWGVAVIDLLFYVSSVTTSYDRAKSCFS